MNEYLQGIKKSDKLILKKMQKKLYPQIRRFILNNNGEEADVQDVYQDAVISLFTRLQREDFEIKGTFSTYFFSVCKFIWFKKAKKKKNVSLDAVPELEDSQNIEEELVRKSKRDLFKKALSELGENCRKVLEYFFSKKSFKEIAELMGYASEEVARRKKYLCKNDLVKRIKDAGEFRELREF